MKLFRFNSYCNPDDPRDFIFASSTNDRLGVLPNLARGRAKRICRQVALPLALVQLPCLALYLYNREFFPLLLVVLGAIGMAVVKGGMPPKNEIMAILFVLLLLASAFGLLVGDVGQENGEKRYYLLEGDILKPISAEDAYAK